MRMSSSPIIGSIQLHNDLTTRIFLIAAPEIGPGRWEVVWESYWEDVGFLFFGGLGFACGGGVMRVGCVSLCSVI
jgi:hypothetical protein